MTEKQACHFDEENKFVPCQGMQMLLDSQNELTGIGARVLHTINMKSLEKNKLDEHDIGVVYKMTKAAAQGVGGMRTTEIMMNSCPLCAKPIMNENFMKKEETG